MKKDSAADLCAELYICHRSLRYGSYVSLAGRPY